MTEPNTFLADLIRGIAASAPKIEEEGFIERHSVLSLSLGLSLDPLRFFEPADASCDCGDWPSDWPPMAVVHQRGGVSVAR